MVGCSDLGSKLQGRLRVTVLKATGLKRRKKYCKTDPYVQLFVRAPFKGKTKTISSNFNPEWNHHNVFEFDVEEAVTQTLILQVTNLSLKNFYASIKSGV